MTIEGDYIASYPRPNYPDPAVGVMPQSWGPAD